SAVVAWKIISKPTKILFPRKEINHEPDQLPLSQTLQSVINTLVLALQAKNRVPCQKASATCSQIITGLR
ncbi:MAG TPA: hypothetical protein V6D30_09085, partial [Leptolyngbyaceae cyanobacterium]